MHKKPNKNINYYAKILLVFSITLFLYGIIISFFDNNNSINRTLDVKKTKDESTVSVTTVDDTDIGANTDIITNDNENINNDNPTVNNDNNNDFSVISNARMPLSEDEAPTIDIVNKNLKKEIENSYGVSVKYGSDTNGYTVAGLTTEPITDEILVYNQLLKLKDTLSLYPSGMFKEIKNGGIPLTIILINSYSEPTVTGITDSSYSYADISISAAYAFEESFYHESYHYIERYLFKRGANYNTWDTLNPIEFSGWGVINGNLSYNVTFSSSSPFVNNYAQTAATEDRASTFEYMMADTKASCLNEGNTVWKKAVYMSRTIEAVLNCASPNTVEYWERYL